MSVRTYIVAVRQTFGGKWNLEDKSRAPTLLSRASQNSASPGNIVAVLMRHFCEKGGSTGMPE
jgi:hypothetical protein